MADALEYIVNKHAEGASLSSSNLQKSETVLLCRNALVSIGLKHLLEGTCFSITVSAADEASFSGRYPNTSPTLLMLNGSDTPGHIIDTARSLKG